MDKNYISFSNFESVSDFILSLNHGREIEFCWKGVYYGAFHEEDNVYSVNESDKPETEVVFNSVNELMDFVIQGQPLKDIITRVEVCWRNI